jgi:hypothetical protein
MTSNTTKPPHPRHAELVADIREYLSQTGQSVRWFGIKTANNPRLVEGLTRGQHYPAAVMIAVMKRLRNHYQRMVEQLTAELAPEPTDLARAA